MRFNMQINLTISNLAQNIHLATKILKLPALATVVLLSIFAGLIEPVFIPTALNQNLIASAARPNDAIKQTLSTNVYLPYVESDSGGTGGSGTSANWPMAAANPERTSWSPEEVSGNLHLEWYRPIEAYIPQNVQIIAADGLLYLSTARGLYALNANTGEVVWRYDTKLPLGNSPTFSESVLYVGGYDRKIHALDANNGIQLWEFSGAKAGYDTNPLVIEDKVIAGNRDGYMYAIGAQNSPNQGQLIWKYKTGGPIHFSAAYKDGVIYFASDDSYAYALRSNNGNLVWKSDKLPGDGYHSFWPVIYQDKVIFSAAPAYRMGIDPGTATVKDSNGNGYGTIRNMEVGDLFPGEPNGTQVGPELPAQSWSHGYPIIDAARITEHFEANPDGDPYKHKPWRRTVIVLNTQNGSEYTFDSDQDGHPEYAPIAYWGTNSGNRYPPIVGIDDIVYQNNLYTKTGDSQGRVMGWDIGTRYLSVLRGQGAIAEPQALSAGGNLIYRSLCCDRVADYFDIHRNGIHPGTLWSYDLSEQAPGYDDMWTILPGWPRLLGWYKGNTASINGIYHNHGDQNPIIPYQGQLYTHRSNAIIAYGTGAARGKLPLVEIQPATSNPPITQLTELKGELESEIQKIIDAGLLRPGYYNNGQFQYPLTDYFENPGDTLLALSIAYPYLSAGLQSQLKAYLQNEFTHYFYPTTYTDIGWSEGVAREAMPFPPEIEASFANYPPRPRSGGFSWSYPPINFYALWKYALVAPENTATSYEIAKDNIQVPVPDVLPTPINQIFEQYPYELNAYIAGYTGFLELQVLAGKAGEDSQLRSEVQTELNRLLQLRADTFNKDTYFIENIYQKRSLNVARNFMFLVPELGDYLNQHALAKVNEAVSEYDYIAPYWFVSRFESMMNEGAMSPLYNSPAMFQAKAFILKESRDELVKYLDVPAFERGDLFHIQNLVAAIEAPASVRSTATTGLGTCEP